MQAYPQAIELAPDALKDIVQQATRAQKVQLLDWQAHPLSGGREAVSSLYLVEVNAQLGNSSQVNAFKFVLKVVHMTPERRSTEHWNYWHREAEAYQSGALAELPSGLFVPRCYVVTTHEDVVWIWLEHIAGQHDTKWSDAEIGSVAFDLGRFNGAYLTGAPLPEGAWVSRNWLRQYVNDCAVNIEQLPDLHTHPLVSRAVAPHLLPNLLRLIDEREQLFNRLDGLPQVFAHQDAHRGNLFITATPANELHLIAVDWSFAGVAAVGQELAPLLFTNRRVPAIYDLVTRRYIAGLDAVGWHGNETALLWSAAITAALTYGVAMVGFFIGNLLDERQHADLAKGFGVAVEALPPRVTAWVEFGLHYYDLAQQVWSA